MKENDVVILYEIHTVHLNNCGGILEELQQYVKDISYSLTSLYEPNHLGTFHSTLRKLR